MVEESRLAKVRKEKGILSAFIAEKVGVSRPSYTNYELGNTNIPADVALKICEILNVRLEDIFLPSAFTIRKQGD